ncbi:AEC family transporter [Parvibium lacunae]|uniref:AEC family transporter n=1 Tax=Parvibium lacunae TaxID=1888893 RepID=A0A368L1U0_9BURK|nr:AEC family transporter [Parvibium lacunae]RCS57340.1 AEC family transporter [Parvibium lacunae]
MAALLLPDFALILLGWGLYRGLRWPSEFWATLEKLVFFVLFPALLFHSVIRTSFDLVSTATLLKTSFAATLAGGLLGYGLRLTSRVPALTFASGVQCAFRFNSYIGLALAVRLGGEEGLALMAVIIGFNVPFCNIAAVWGLARHGETRLWQELLRNPLIVATVSALLLNIIGWHPPEVMMTTLQRLGSASVALGLIAVGAGIRLAGVNEARWLSSAWLMLKLFVNPLIAYWVGRQFGLASLPLKIVVLFAGLPTASSAYILATRMGGNGPLVAYLISASTLLSILTLPLWLSLV